MTRFDSRLEWINTKFCSPLVPFVLKIIEINSTYFKYFLYIYFLCKLIWWDLYDSTRSKELIKYIFTFISFISDKNFKIFRSNCSLLSFLYYFSCVFFIWQWASEYQHCSIQKSNIDLNLHDKSSNFCIFTNFALS